MKAYIVQEVEPKAEPVEVAPTNSVTIPLDDIGMVKRPEKRTASMYLSVDVLEELGKRAQKVNMRSSAYLDELLKRVFEM